MKKIIFTLLTIFTLNLNAQNDIALKWAKALNNDQPQGGDVMGSCIKVDGNGNVYVTGYFSGTADFDPGAGVVNLQSAGGNDVFIAKYSASGAYVFAKNMGGANNEQGNSIALDAFGNIYITGFFTTTADFDPGAGVAILTSGVGAGDMFFAKYDTAGNYVFAKNTTTSGGTFVRGAAGSSIAIDGNGNAYITGSFYGTTDFDPGSGTFALTSQAGSGFTDGDIFVAKYDATGNYVYANRFGVTYDDKGNSIAVDAVGNTYVTGYFGGTVDFDPGSGTASQAGTTQDIFFAKYDAGGNYLYAKRLGGPGQSRVGNSIAIDGSGNVYLTGWFNGTTDFDPGVGTQNLIPAGTQQDIFIAKYDATGNYVYAKGIGGTRADIGESIVTDNSGNVYVTGSFLDTVDFDPGIGTAIFMYNGINDLFYAKYDASGNYVYAKRIGGVNSESGSSIALDGSGNVHIAGRFRGTVDFNPDAATNNLQGATSYYNCAIGKYSATGNYVWAGALGGYSAGVNADLAKDIARDASGNLYITGSFSGTVDFNPGVGVANLTSLSVTGTDLFFAKYDSLGNYIYAKCTSGKTYSVGNSIAVDASGNVYLTGYFRDTVDFDPGVGVVKLSSSVAYGYVIFFAKYNASGNLVYAKQLEDATGGTVNDLGNSIAVDGSGNVYLTGSFTGTIDFDPGVGTVSLTSAGGADIFHAKYDANGAYLYAKRVGGTSTEGGRGIAVDASGNTYITGYFQGSMSFTNFPFFGVTLSSTGSNDIFIAKCNAAGDYIYAKKMGGTGSDMGNDIAIIGNGKVVITGSFSGTADFDPNAGTVSLISAGNTDLFVAKYDSLANYVYASQIGGIADEAGKGIAVDAMGNTFITGTTFIAKNDSFGNLIYTKDIPTVASNSIAADANGNVYVTGSFPGTVDFDPGDDTVLLNSVNNTDIFIARYTENFSITTGSVIATPHCSGAALSVPFTEIGNFNPGNVFTVQLSNASGSFASPVSIGTLTAIVAGTINATIPLNTTTGTGYRVRVVSSSPVLIGSPNGVNITINQTLTTGISIALTAGGNPICPGSSLTYTATPTNAGTSPTYNWKINGNSVQNNTSPTYTSSALTNGQVVSCVITSNYVCPSPATATSNSKTVSILNTYGVSITAGGSTTFCAGQSVVLMAHDTGGISYTWKLNGNILPSQTSNTLAATLDGNYNVEVGYSNGCTNTTSQGITLTLISGGLPQPTISVSSTVDLSTGSFTTYQWQRNGNNIPGANSQNYTATQSGNYTVSVTNASGCGNVSPGVNVVVQGATGLQCFNSWGSSYSGCKLSA